MSSWGLLKVASYKSFMLLKVSLEFVSGHGLLALILSNSGSFVVLRPRLVVSSGAPLLIALSVALNVWPGEVPAGLAISKVTFINDAPKTTFG